MRAVPDFCQQKSGRYVRGFILKKQVKKTKRSRNSTDLKSALQGAFFSGCAFFRTAYAAPTSATAF